MSVPSSSLDRSERSSVSSDSSSSSDLPDDSSPRPTSHSHLPARHTMDRWQGRQFSQSSPALVNEPRDEDVSRSDRGPNAPALQPRHHSAIASHFLAQPAHTFGGQTWMDFLRESGAEHVSSRASNTIHRSPVHPRAASASYSRQPPWPQRHSSHSVRNGERARHMSTPEAPTQQRSGQGVCLGNATGTPEAGGSAPIVVGGPSSLPRRPRSPHPRHPSLPLYPSRSSFDAASRHSSDIVLPTWQPDSEVTHCPVCSRQFTFWYRKHHCRKCGRVVCSNCSPHRITIPRQFIVQPPSLPSPTDMMDHSEERQDEDAQDQDLANFLQGARADNAASRSSVQNSERRRDSQLFPNSYPFSSQQSSPFNPRNTSTTRYGIEPAARQHNPFSLHDLSANLDNPNPALGGGSTVRVCNPCVPDPNLSPPPQQLPQTPRGGDRIQPPFHTRRPRNQDELEQTLRERGMQGRPVFPPPSPPVQRPFQPVSRDHNQRALVTEEDECPVCGNELPPLGFRGDDSLRVVHIEVCLMKYSSSPAPALATGRMSGGKVVWVATEKDCVNQDAEPVECVICLEEFAAGEKMARLRCFCKFHDECIHQWWTTKGYGACPTHQLHK
ncbi:FYVE-domain-containing protein [Lophiostoma macrostomum CBS 122681]|uniref:RING-type E3 ubiquitin transferase n=1 Tax=Lophiostoma macrostomum CBS 122681 TaxID=1314788 RepID=A0A6A6TEF7_9PLEO|nr:FYVE-domain-containing protein [Lophiostoma macrostomum CBS 122681]